MPIMKIRSFLVALILFGMTMTIASARAQSDREESSADVTAPVEPTPPDIDESKLFTELLGYTEQRTYEVTDTTGKVRAQESGQMEYRAPDKKTFVTTSESGSGLVRR